jgi:5-oxoprolinase (ATP-hydrolysing) subunit A
MPLEVDLNADVGEECGDDAALLAVVTTASVAAGGHAGGGEVLVETVRMAVRAGVAVGAHPSYPDRGEFGRVSRAADHDAVAIRAFVRDQVLSVAAACHAHGIALSHVKAHGALYNDVAADADLASVFVDGVQAAGRDLGGADLRIMGMPGTELDRVCSARGLGFLAEAFADRAYAPDGSLVPRGVPGAVLHDAGVVADRVLRLVTDGRVRAIDGTELSIPAMTVCLHGDTPGSVEMARLVRRRLEANGITITAPAGPS